MIEAASEAELRELLDPAIGNCKVQPLLDKANELTRKASGGRGFIWTPLGINSDPCGMGCRFCSHASKWGIYRATPPMSQEEILRKAGEVADAGSDFVVLRTTQQYPLQTLLECGRKVRDRIGPEPHMVVNTGEMSLDTVKALRDAGFTMTYHVVRLREGIDTGHTVAMRLRTIENALKGGLEVFYLVEPLGPEHTADEILQEARRAASLGASGTGVMARVPIMGTPLAHYGQVAPAYVARVAAATRLCYPDCPFVCVHPPTPATLHMGANVIIVEQGAIPRDTITTAGPWNGFDMPQARAALKAANLTVRAVAE